MPFKYDNPILCTDGSVIKIVVTPRDELLLGVLGKKSVTEAHLTPLIAVQMARSLTEAANVILASEHAQSLESDLSTEALAALRKNGVI